MQPMLAMQQPGEKLHNRRVGFKFCWDGFHLLKTKPLFGVVGVICLKSHNTIALPMVQLQAHVGFFGVWMLNLSANAEDIPCKEVALGRQTCSYRSRETGQPKPCWRHGGCGFQASVDLGLILDAGADAV